MKNLSSIDSTTSPPKASPGYTLADDGFNKELSEAMYGLNRREEKMGKIANQTQTASSAYEQLQFSVNQINPMAQTKFHSTKSAQSYYKAQKSGVRSKLAADF